MPLAGSAVVGTDVRSPGARAGRRPHAVRAGKHYHRHPQHRRGQMKIEDAVVVLVIGRCDATRGRRL